MHISIPLGIAIGLLASFIQSLGLTFQRKSHVLNDALPFQHRKLEYRRPLWLLGFAIFISSNALGFLVQIASLPVVILAPLGAVSLLWNAFFARLLLGDVFSPWVIVGTLLIAGGAVVIAQFGIVPEQTRSLEDLLHLFSRPAFIVYFSLLSVVFLVAVVIAHVVEFSLRKRLAAQSYPLQTSPRSPSLTPNRSIALVADTNELPTERTPLLDPKFASSTSAFSLSNHDSLSTRRTHILLALAYSSFSGIISGMCLLFAKSGVELLLLTLQGHNQFWRWQAWMLVICLLVFALLQLWYLQKALLFAGPIIVCPSGFCVYNISSIINGLVYFDQFSLIPPLHLCLVALGIVVLLGGVWVVSIHSGGGGVDVGTWEEVEEEEEALSTTDSEAAYPEGEGIHGQRIFASPLNPLFPALAEEPSGDEHEHEHDRPSHGGINYERRMSSMSSLRGQPVTHEQTMADSVPLSPSTSGSKRRRLTRRDAYSNLSAADYGGGGSLRMGFPGPGFQIGLSAVSPGFAILPRERIRRRTSGQGGSGGFPHGNDDDSREAVGERQPRRRAVSESCLGGSTGRSVCLNATAAPVEREEVANNASSPEDVQAEDPSLKGGRMWRLLRRFLRR